MTLLHIQIAEASYDAIPVLHDIDLQIIEGAFIAVIGANTAGKSTLLKSISGLMPNVKGKISLSGENLLQLPAHEIPARGVAHVPEGRHVFPFMSVEENLWLGGYCRRHNETALRASLEKIYVMFPRLAERAKQLAGTLSGGEQQMVAIGRALMGDPKLLLLDEPCSSLDRRSTELIMRVIAGLSIPVMMATHDLSLLKDFDRIVWLESGAVVNDGAPQAVIAAYEAQ